MLSRRTRPFLTLALLLVASAVSAQTPTEILANHAKAVDPEGKLPTIQGMKMTANFEVPAAGMAGSVLVQRRPNQTAMTIGLPGLGEMRSGYDGTTAWASDPMQGPRLLSGLEAATAAENADFRSVTRTPDLFTAMELAGEAEVGGEKCIKIKHTWKSSRVSVDCYSTTNWLIIESTATQVSPQGEMTAITQFSDFRSVGGIMLAHKMTVSAMGMQQIVTTTSVEFGEQPAAAIEPPAEVKALKKP